MPQKKVDSKFTKIEAEDEWQDQMVSHLVSRGVEVGKQLTENEFLHLTAAITTESIIINPSSINLNKSV